MHLNLEEKKLLAENIKSQMFDYDKFCVQNLVVAVHMSVKNSMVFKCKVVEDGDEFKNVLVRTNKSLDPFEYTSFSHFAQESLTGMYLPGSNPPVLQTYEMRIRSLCDLVFGLMIKHNFSMCWSLYESQDVEFMALLEGNGLTPQALYDDFITFELSTVFDYGKRLYPGEKCVA